MSEKHRLAKKRLKAGQWWAAIALWGCCGLATADVGTIEVGGKYTYDSGMVMRYWFKRTNPNGDPYYVGQNISRVLTTDWQIRVINDDGKVGTFDDVVVASGSSGVQTDSRWDLNCTTQHLGGGKMRTQCKAQNTVHHIADGKFVWHMDTKIVGASGTKFQWRLGKATHTNGGGQYMDPNTNRIVWRALGARGQDAAGNGVGIELGSKTGIVDVRDQTSGWRDGVGGNVQTLQQPVQLRIEYPSQITLDGPNASHWILKAAGNGEIQSTWRTQTDMLRFVDCTGSTWARNGSARIKSGCDVRVEIEPGSRGKYGKYSDVVNVEWATP